MLGNGQWHGMHGGLCQAELAGVQGQGETQELQLLGQRSLGPLEGPFLLNVSGGRCGDWLAGSDPACAEGTCGSSLSSTWGFSSSALSHSAHYLLSVSGGHDCC